MALLLLQLSADDKFSSYMDLTLQLANTQVGRWACFTTAGFYYSSVHVLLQQVSLPTKQHTVYLGWRG